MQEKSSVTSADTGIKADIIFKGGTSLSKCYKLIDRFSEVHLGIVL